MLRKYTSLALLMCTIWQLIHSDDTNIVTDDVTCRDKHGTLGFDDFVSRSCVMCYSYLFTGQGLYQPSGHKFTSMTLLNASRAVDYGDVTLPRHVMPDPRNDTATSAVCLSLSDDECARWLSCCQDAVTCCHRQADTPVADGGDSSQGSESCPRIWDGYGCWDDQAPGTVAKQSCPYFLKHSITTKDASKTCLADGTWFMKSGMQWTDYTGCMSIHSHMTVVYISLTCSAISLLLLVPSTVIFLIYRELRKQQRVRLHINFFIALALSAAFSIMWYSLVHYDMLANTEQTQAVINRNPAWCRVLSFGKIYFSSCTFSWMFCEGIYLHRLITKAFSPPKHLFLLYIIGWSVPALPALCYSIIRAVLANDSCWAKSYGYYEWIIYTPNVICLVVNMIFLCNILWILLFKMRSHPHEPNNFRRGFKAACMLVPLFGLQMLLTIYRPDDSWSLAHYYECLAHVINNSQGICVALIFCVFNGEVSHQIRSTCSCLPCMSPPPRRGRMSSAPTTMVSTCDDVKSSINPSRSTSGGGFNAATNNGSAGGGGGGDRETQAQLLRRSRDCSDVTTPDEPVEMTVYSKTDASTNGSATVTGNRNDAGADETSNLVIHASDA